MKELQKVHRAGEDLCPAVSNPSRPPYCVASLRIERVGCNFSGDMARLDPRCLVGRVKHAWSLKWSTCSGSNKLATMPYNFHNMIK